MANAGVLGADFTAGIGFVQSADGDLAGGSPASFGAFRRVLDASVRSSKGGDLPANAANNEAQNAALATGSAGAERAGAARDPRTREADRDDGAPLGDGDGSRPVDAGVTTLTFANGDLPAADGTLRGAVGGASRGAADGAARDAADGTLRGAANGASRGAANGATRGAADGASRGAAPDGATLPSPAFEGDADSARAIAFANNLHPGGADRLTADPLASDELRASNDGVELAPNGQERSGSPRDASLGRALPFRDDGASITRAARGLVDETRGAARGDDGSTIGDATGDAIGDSDRDDDREDGPNTAAFLAVAWQAPAPLNTVAHPPDTTRDPDPEGGDSASNEAVMGASKRAGSAVRQGTSPRETGLDEGPTPAFPRPTRTGVGLGVDIGSDSRVSHAGQGLEGGAPDGAPGASFSRADASSLGLRDAGASIQGEEGPSTAETGPGAPSGPGAEHTSPRGGQGPFGAAGQGSFRAHGQGSFGANGQAGSTAAEQSGLGVSEQTASQTVGQGGSLGGRARSGDPELRDARGPGDTAGRKGSLGERGAGSASDAERGLRTDGSRGAALRGADTGPSALAAERKAGGGSVFPQSLRAPRSLRIPGASLYNASSFGRARPATDEQIRGTLDAFPGHDVAEYGAPVPSISGAGAGASGGVGASNGAGASGGVGASNGAGRSGRRASPASMRAVSLPNGGAPIGSVEEIEGAFAEGAQSRSPSIVSAAPSRWPNVRIFDANESPASLRTPKDRAQATSATMRPPAAPVDKPSSGRRAPPSVTVDSPAERLASSIAGRIATPESGNMPSARWTAPSTTGRNAAFAEEASLAAGPAAPDGNGTSQRAAADAANAPRWTDLHALWTEAEPAYRAARTATKGAEAPSLEGARTRPFPGAETAALRDSQTRVLREAQAAAIRGAETATLTGAEAAALNGAETGALGARKGSSGAGFGALHGASNKGASLSGTGEPLAGDSASRSDLDPSAARALRGDSVRDRALSGAAERTSPLVSSPVAGDAERAAPHAGRGKADSGRSHVGDGLSTTAGEGLSASAAEAMLSSASGRKGAFPEGREATIHTQALTPEAAPISAASGWSPDTQRDPQRSREMAAVAGAAANDTSADAEPAAKARASTETTDDAAQTPAHTAAPAHDPGALLGSSGDHGREARAPAEPAPAMTANLLSHLEERLVDRRKQVTSSALRGHETRAEAHIPDFGRISVEAQTRGERIDLRVTAHEAEAGQALREARPAMESHLRDNQVPLGHLSLGDRSQAGSSGAGTGNDHRHQEQAASQPEAADSTPAAAPRPNGRVRVIL